MFGKKEKNKIEPPKPITARIETMPGAFYAGADPVIYASSNEKVASNQSSQILPQITSVPKVPPLVQKPVVPSNSSPVEKPLIQKPVAAPPARNKKILFFVIFICIFAAAIFGYYFYRGLGNKNTNNETVSVVSTTPPFIASPPQVPLTNPTSTEIEVPVSTNTSTEISPPTIRGGGALTLPTISYAVSRDSDADTLTNREEDIFQTDPEVWDTDSDGYYDGLEVKNLYNPKGIAPQKIIDSGLVKEYINPLYQYKFYYPFSWRVDAVAQDFSDILISSDSGDYIEIRVFPKSETLSFQGWFSDFLPTENFLSLNTFSNRFQVPGYKRADNQVGFFETPTAIYSVIYFYGEEKNLYPNVMEIVMQSFRAGSVSSDLPVQPILPGIVVPSSSSQSSVVVTTTETSFPDPNSVSI